MHIYLSLPSISKEKKEKGCDDSGAYINIECEHKNYLFRYKN